MQLLSSLPLILLPLRKISSVLIFRISMEGWKQTEWQSSQVCLSRKSVMAFHSVQSIPPLFKDTRTWWREHFIWNIALEIEKWLLSFQLLWSESEDPLVLSVILYSFCIYYLIIPPMPFLSTPTNYQVRKHHFRFSALLKCVFVDVHVSYVYAWLHRRK